MKLRSLTFFSQVVLIGIVFILGAFLPTTVPFVSDMVCAAEVTLAWDANSESTLAGYRLYYDSENDSESYKGTDANEGESPITIYLNELEDLSSPFYTISGLEEGVCYYFVLTAFDQEGLESDFSDEVGFGNFEAGGGNGCFISGLIGNRAEN